MHSDTGEEDPVVHVVAGKPLFYQGVLKVRMH